MVESARSPTDETSPPSEESPPLIAPHLGRFPPVGAAELGQLADLAEELLKQARDIALEPSHVKVLRTWNQAEVAALLGMPNDDALRRWLKKEPELPQGTLIRGRRNFTLEDIHGLQAGLGIRPRRDPDIDKPVVIAACNFKGGVAKTTTTVHLAQYLCLRGYRTLLVDFDAQASLTQLFGILPHTEVDESQTALPWFEGEKGPNWTGTLKSAIRPTHWHDLDLLCSNLAFYGAEFAISNRLVNEAEFRFYKVLAEGMATIKDDYDVIIVDTAPSLSFINSNALYAIDAILVTLPPAMMDLQSAGLFFRWLEELVTLFNSVESAQKVYDFLCILITRMKTAESEAVTKGGRKAEAKARKAQAATHKIISEWIKARFPQFTISTPMVETAVLTNIGPEILTAYEVRSYEGNSRTFDRALQALNAVNAEIESAIQSVWQRARATAGANGSGA